MRRHANQIGRCNFERWAVRRPSSVASPGAAGPGAQTLFVQPTRYVAVARDHYKTAPFAIWRHHSITSNRSRNMKVGQQCHEVFCSFKPCSSSGFQHSELIFTPLSGFCGAHRSRSGRHQCQPERCSSHRASPAERQQLPPRQQQQPLHLHRCDHQQLRPLSP